MDIMGTKIFGIVVKFHPIPAKARSTVFLLESLVALDFPGSVLKIEGKHPIIKLPSIKKKSARWAELDR